MAKSFKDTDAAVIEAKKHSEAVKGLDKTLNEAWWELGKHANAVHQRKLWQALEMKSFGAWMTKYASASRKTVYDAMLAWKELRQIPESLRRKIPKQNAKRLAKLPESKRKANRWIAAAINMTENEFRAAVDADKVGAEKVEEFVTKHFHFEVSRWATIERGIEDMINFEGVATPEEVFEMWAADHLAGVDRSAESSKSQSAA